MSKREYTVSYSGIRGVDLSSGDDTSRERMAYLENMWRDYEGDGGSLIESVPGFRRIASFGERIYSVFTQRGEGEESYIVVHAGTSLYRFPHSERDSLAPLSPIASISATKSTSFSYGYELYILDGKNILRIDKDGKVTRVGLGGTSPYIPTTYVNGVPYEQKNLLTDEFYEEFLVSSTDLVTHGTKSLQYRITDPVAKLCAVVGIGAGAPSRVNIPSFIKIGTETYRVYEIYDGALAGSDIVELIIGEGVVRIGRSALEGSDKLTTVRCPESMSKIESSAFAGCTSLRDVYIGTGMTYFGENVFTGLMNVALHYTADLSSLKNVVGYDGIKSHVSVSTTSSDRSVTVEIPISTPATSVTGVTVNGENITYTISKEGDLTTAILISVTDSRTLEGKLIRIRARAATGGDASDLFSDTGYTGSGADAVLGSRIAECFDGRIFLAGNPKLPNTVIYSQRDRSGRNNPLYYGVYNYFTDGVGAFPVISMLAQGDALLVFKSGDDGGGSIFYHTPKDTDSDLIPRIYPVAYVHSGVVALGDSISFYDDPIFISSGGVFGIDKRILTLERSISARSHNVNSYLLRERLGEARLAKWSGYLVLSVGGHIYLADSRQRFTHRSGSVEYEWFFLSGIGVYENATRVYRYASLTEDGFDPSDTPDEPSRTTVMSYVGESGETVYYTEEGEKRYRLYPTEQTEGGDFFPATSLASLDATYLYFGTDSGALCIFNNDKRGVAPERIRGDGFSEEEYALTSARRLHRDFYDFDGRSVRYALVTREDNGSLPHLAKNTVAGSLTLKMRLGGASPLSVEVGTDRSGYSERALISSLGIDFSDVDLSSLTLTAESDTTIPIGEKEKGWIEKEISVYSDGFRSPIGIYSITYRFTERGKIKMP